jgi:hypothetical protein
MSPEYTPHIDSSPLSQQAVRSLSVVHNGVTYRGALVTLESWEPKWGEELRGEDYFRVVFLSETAEASRLRLEDARIAVCAPGGESPRQRGAMEREVLSIREARERYLTRPGRGEEGLRRTLEKQEREIETLLWDIEARRHRTGTVITTGTPIDPSDVFTGGDMEEWGKRVASRLLTSYYPKPWLEIQQLQRPLTPLDADAFFRALFAEGGTSAKAPVEELGPALGLSRPTHPYKYNPQDCRVFRMIRETLGERADVSWDEIHHHLAHGEGLTGPFATLFLLLFVYQGQPEVEIRLRRACGLTLRNGHAMPGDRVIRETVPLLPWSEGLSAKFASLCQPREVSWNSALHYTSLVCEGLAEVDESGEPGAQVGRLHASLKALSGDLARGRETLSMMASSGLSLHAEEVEEILSHLESLARCEGFQEFFERARSLCGAPEELHRELEGLKRLLHVHPLLPEILDARSYLENAEIAAGYPDLSLDRESLLQRLTIPVVLEGPRSWDAVKASFHQFKRRYRNTYAAFHSSYRDGAVAMRLQLDGARQKLAALDYLNSLAELGSPVGRGLKERLESLTKAVRACSGTEDDLQLEHCPRCLECGLRLGERLPAGEADSLVAEVESALGQQNLRLSRVLVRDIMEGRADQRLDDLLKIVRASDLSALANTLDEEMVEFIRGLLV